MHDMTKGKQCMYRIGICDDDKELCSGLEDQIYRVAGELSIKAEVDVWYTGEGILEDLRKGIHLDMIFLDIELVQKNGIAVGKYIRDEMEDMQTHIVYISAMENYAMQLFKVQPLDFLVKPVSDGQIKEVLLRSIKQRKRSEAFFEFQKGNSVLRISTNDILYFMSMDRKILIVKKDGQEEFYGKLKSIADNLPSDFMMIHQSYIVNQMYVSEYTYEWLKMMNDTVINISKPYRKDVRAKIKQYQKAKTHDIF